MAILGITLDKTNPTFNKEDFTFWMPQYANFMATTEGTAYFNKLKLVVNKKIFKSIYGTDWELAMSLAIAHYLELIARQAQNPSGNTLNSVSGGGATKGIMTGVQVGQFNKQYDLDKSLVVSDEAIFWNQTSYGAQLMALLKTKAIPSVLVVTNNNVPGSGSYEC